MKILFIYKTAPDEVTKTLAKEMAEGNEVREFNLYEEPVDYHRLLDLIFEAEKVVTWW
jgi:hypothetical protein